MNLREQVESDLSFTLEGAWALPVDLLSPNGVWQRDLKGQILYDTVKTNPDTGEPVVVNNPIVTLRRSSLSPCPAPGEKWLVRIPITPSVSASKNNFIIDPSRPPEGGSSIGMIRLYLHKVIQT